MAGPFTNRARATSADGRGAEAMAVTVVRAPVLALECQAPAEVQVGSAIEVCLTLANTGAAAEPKATVVLPIPPGATVSGTTEGGSVTDGRVVWEVAALAPGARPRLCATFSTREPGTLAFVGSAQGTCAPAVESRCESRVAGIAAILLEVVDLEDPVELGNPVTYEIKVLNQGNGPLTRVRLAASTPEGQEFVSGSGASTVTAEGVKLELSNLNAGFEGTLAMDGKTLSGNWTQGGASLPLTLTRTTAEAVKPKPAVKGRVLFDEERQFAIGNLERTRKLVLEATKDVSAEQAKFKAGPERWSILEIAEHLGTIEDLLFGFATGQVMKIPSNFGLAERTVEQLKAADQQVLAGSVDRSKKGQAPEPAKPTGRYATLADAQKAFEEKRAKSIAYMRETQDDLRNHGSPSPGGGVLDAYQYLLILAGHAERHTLQINEVKAAAGYPAK